MKISKFTDLDVWKEAHVLTLQIYKISSKFPKSELYGLTSQVRRAAVSIESCIAEGFCRFHYKDRLNFYYGARGSLGEVQAQIIVAKDLSFVNQAEFKKIIDQAEKVGLILSGLLRSTEKLSKR